MERLILEPPTYCRRHSVACHVLAFLGIGAALTGCGDVPSVTQPGPPQPAIQLLLVTNTSEQVATVLYSTPAESIVPLVPVPIAPESVALAIRTAAGAAVALTPIPGAPGRFQATLSITPGETYRLAGSVVGRSIEAYTTVPGPLIVREPAADTLRMSEGAGRVQVPYAWHAVGSTAYLVQVTSTESPIGGARILEDTSGVLIADLDLHPGRPETSLFTVFALDSAAAAFFRPLSATAPRPGNIAGALGLFGSASVLDPPKVVLWQ